MISYLFGLLLNHELREEPDAVSDAVPVDDPVDAIEPEVGT